MTLYHLCYINFVLNKNWLHVKQFTFDTFNNADVYFLHYTSTLCYKLFMSTHFYFRLYQYEFNDVLFAHEEAAYDWCGMPERECLEACNATSAEEGDWWKCADRLMSARLAFRLRRLAYLVQQAAGYNSKCFFILTRWHSRPYFLHL